MASGLKKPGIIALTLKTMHTAETSQIYHRSIAETILKTALKMLVLFYSLIWLDKKVLSCKKRIRKDF